MALVHGELHKLSDGDDLNTGFGITPSDQPKSNITPQINLPTISVQPLNRSELTDLENRYPSVMERIGSFISGLRFESLKSKGSAMVVIGSALAVTPAYGLILVDTIGPEDQYLPQAGSWFASDVPAVGTTFFAVYQPLTNPTDSPVKLTQWVEWRGVAGYQTSYPMDEHRIAISSSLQAALASPKVGDLFNGVTTYTAIESPDKTDSSANPVNKLTHDLTQLEIVIPGSTTVWASIFSYRYEGVQLTGKVEGTFEDPSAPHVQIFRNGHMFLRNSWTKQYDGVTLDRVEAQPVPEPGSSTSLAVGLLGIMALRRKGSK